MVASVSSIYGLGNPADYRALMLHLAVGDEKPRKDGGKAKKAKSQDDEKGAPDDSGAAQTTESERAAADGPIAAALRSLGLKRR